MAVVQVNENTLDFIFDSNTNFYNQINTINHLLTLKENTEIYYYNENDTLVNTNYSYQEGATLDFDASNIPSMDIYVNCFHFISLQFLKYNQEVIDGELNIKKDQWYITLDGINLIKTKGFRIENFEYAEGQTLETINTLVNPYIGTKTSFAKTYTLKVNGKLLNTINGKKIRNLIYNGTTYEIAYPVASGYTLTIEVSDNIYVKNGYYKINGGSAQNTGYQQQTIVINNVEKVAFGASAWDSGFVPDIGAGFYIGSTEGGQEYGKISTNDGGEIEITLTGDTTIYLCDGLVGNLEPEIPMP